MRICFRSDSDVTVRKVNGKIIYDTQEIFQQYIELWQTTYPNVSFYFTKQDNTVCEERLRNNESDINSELYAIDKVTDDSFFFVPVIARSSKISIITGYDLKNITRADIASALDSVHLVQDKVYWLIITCVIIFTLLAIVSSVFTHLRELLWLDMMHTVEAFNYQPKRRATRRRTITQPGYLKKFVWHQVEMFIRDHSNGPRWLCMIVTVLVFYLTNFFYASYSTSNIVEKKPDVLNSYEKLAAHPNASVFFMNYALRTSSSFENAPADSLKGNIWARYLKTPASKEPVSLVGFTKFSEYFILLRDHKYAAIGPSIFASTMASAGCAFRGPNEMRHFDITYDPSEHERLYGFAVSIRMKHETDQLRRLILFAQSTLTVHLTHSYAELMYELSGNRDDIIKQRVVCTGSPKDETHHFRPVPITYWITFIYLALGIFCFAFIILLLEHLTMN